MAWTARDVTLRLRSELHDSRLVVKLDHGLGRWVVCVRRKMLTGARTLPFIVRDEGAVEPGRAIMREVAPHDEIVYVHQTPEGEYLSLEPNVMRHELEKRDTHRRNLVAELLGRVKASRKKADDAFQDDIRQRTKHYRRAFARVAEDMGLSGKPDYSRIFGRRLIA